MKIKIGGKEFEVSNEDVTKSIEGNTELVIEQDVVIREKSEDETFITNIKAESKKAGVEIAIKETRTALGLSFEGKTMDNLIDAVKSKTLEDAKIEPEKKVAQLTKDIETLKSTNQSILEEKTRVESQFKNYKSENTINSIIFSNIPENSVLGKDDMALVVKNKLKFSLDENDNVIVLDQNGEVLKDSILNPIKPQDAVKSFFSENTQYLKSAGGGAGGNDSGGQGSKLGLTKFIEEQKALGINPQSDKFRSNLKELTDKDLIDMES